MTADQRRRESKAKQGTSLSCYKIQERKPYCNGLNGPHSATTSGPVRPAKPGKVQSIGSSLPALSLTGSTAPPLAGKASHSATTGADAQQGSPGLQAATSAKASLHDGSDTAFMAASKEMLPNYRETLPEFKAAAGPQSSDTLLWHRPEVLVWVEVQDVALRVIATLDWANSCFDEEQQGSDSTPAFQCFCLELKLHLLRLLHDLLIGHFSDDGMDFWKILAAGLGPVLRSLKGLPAKDVCQVSPLVVALLQRTAHDIIVGAESAPSGTLDNFTDLQQIWSLFGM